MPPPQGRCWTCNYNLRGTPSLNCPECGATFDPHNPKTMNMGLRSLSPLTRRLLNPIGLWAPIAAALSTLLLILITGLPSTTSFSLFEPQYYFSWLITDWRLFKTYTIPHHWNTSTAYLYLLSLALWALLLLYVPARILLRRFLILRHSIPAQHQTRSHKRTSAFFALLLLALLFQSFGWPNRLARHFVSQQLALSPNLLQFVLADTEFPGSFPEFNPHIEALTPHDRQLVEIYAATKLSSPKQRTAALALICETSYSPTLPPEINELLKTQSDPALRLTLLRLLILAGNPSAFPPILVLLHSTNPEERATALDAITILRGGLTLPWGRGALNTDPPIPITNLVEPTRPTPESFALLAAPHTSLPALRELILQTARSASSDREREAARRALVTWPPEKYQLRYAEWGVWLAGGGGGGGGANLKFGPKITAEIPPFAHRVGDTVLSMKDRIVLTIPMSITKPIVHLTTSETLCVDLRIQILYGRPWYVYPMPDDFSIDPPIVMNMHGTLPFPAPLLNLRALDPSTTIPPLPNLRSGIPWVLPNHEVELADSADPEQITAWGFRWESLLLTPTLDPTMKLPSVPSNPHFDWWKNLRQVPSSYLTNRNETERFLYYDGPTNALAPVQIQLLNNSLHTIYPEDDPTPAAALSLRTSATHQGLYIEVDHQKSQAALLTLTHHHGDYPLPALTADAPAQLLHLLTTAGLTPEEAAGLLQSWQSHLFQTPGKRLLLFLTPDEYDQFCPLQLTPEPTQKTRVGLILTEF